MIFKFAGWLVFIAVFFLLENGGDDWSSLVLLLGCCLFCLYCWLMGEYSNRTLDE